MVKKIIFLVLQIVSTLPNLGKVDTALGQVDTH